MASSEKKLKKIYQGQTKIIFDLIYNINPETYFVGGVVRDTLLGKPTKDIDIATATKPETIFKTLTSKGYKVNPKGLAFGSFNFKAKGLDYSVTTFRKDSYFKSKRFPKISLTKTAKADSLRRDFTINALYYSPISGEVLDFHKGLRDLGKKEIKFIGNAKKSILQDPLRIVRAHRFALNLNFKINKNLLKTLFASRDLVKTISKTNLHTEINKIKQKSLRKRLCTTLGFFLD